jgi:hypothetical protein
MKDYKLRRLLLIFIGVVLLLSPAACSPSEPAETSVPEETPVATETEIPTVIASTPTLSRGESVVILLTTADSDRYALTQIENNLNALVEEAGLKSETQEMSSFQMMSNVSLVIGIGDGIDINNLAIEYPEVSFVAVDNQTAQPSSNLSVIGDPIVDQQRRAFMAGYLAGLISDDYKVGALVPSDSSASEMVIDSFVTGVQFYCGLCKPHYPPYQTFPQWQTISTEDLQGTYQIVLSDFVTNGIEVLYVHGDLVSESLLTEIDTLGIKVVSDAGPETSRNNYAGSILSDPGPALIKLWSDLLTKQAGVRLPASIALVERNSEVVSEGRYLLFEEMVMDLQEGLISPEPSP